MTARSDAAGPPDRLIGGTDADARPADPTYRIEPAHSNEDAGGRAPSPGFGTGTMAESTELLLRRIRAGDGQARQALYDRCLPLLLRWAHGRLPGYARSAKDTEDLVQITLLNALRHLEQFQADGAGAFLAYLRQILLNEVRKEIRSQRRHGVHVPIDDHELADTGSVVEQLVQRERLQAYEKALASLGKRQQELVVLRIEFGLSYAEIAAEIGGTPDAARMMIARALQRMAELIGGEQA